MHIYQKYTYKWPTTAQSNRYWLLNILIEKIIRKILSPSTFFYRSSIDQCFRYHKCLNNDLHCLGEYLQKTIDPFVVGICLNSVNKPLIIHIWYLKHCSMFGQWNKLGSRGKHFSINPFITEIFQMKQPGSKNIRHLQRYSLVTEISKDHFSTIMHFSMPNWYWLESVCPKEHE